MPPPSDGRLPGRVDPVSSQPGANAITKRHLSPSPPDNIAGPPQHRTPSLALASAPGHDRNANSNPTVEICRQHTFLDDMVFSKTPDLSVHCHDVVMASLENPSTCAYSRVQAQESGQLCCRHIRDPECGGLVETSGR